jgi:hypothetical protein
MGFGRLDNSADSGCVQRTARDDMVPVDGESLSALGITIASRAHETHGSYRGGDLIIRFPRSSQETVRFYEVRPVAMRAGLRADAVAEVQKLTALQVNLMWRGIGPGSTQRASFICRF